jgi:hypothetical protein
VSETIPCGKPVGNGAKVIAINAATGALKWSAQIGDSFSGLTFVGTPATIAGEMEQWLFEEGGDGFHVMFPYVPEGLDDFVDEVVPELQRRGSFRREYEGKTLRENLGLPRPENPLFKSPKDLSGERAEARLRFDPLRTTDAARFARRLVSPSKTSALGPFRAVSGAQADQNQLISPVPPVETHDAHARDNLGSLLAYEPQMMIHDEIVLRFGSSGRKQTKGK